MRTLFKIEKDGDGVWGGRNAKRSTKPMIGILGCKAGIAEKCSTNNSVPRGHEPGRRHGILEMNRKRIMILAAIFSIFSYNIVHGQFCKNCDTVNAIYFNPGEYFYPLNEKEIVEFIDNLKINKLDDLVLQSYSDGIKIKNNLIYKGEYGNEVSIFGHRIRKGSRISNLELSLLRSYFFTKYNINIDGINIRVPKQMGLIDQKYRSSYVFKQKNHRDSIIKIVTKLDTCISKDPRIEEIDTSSLVRSDLHDLDYLPEFSFVDSILKSTNPEIAYKVVTEQGINTKEIKIRNPKLHVLTIAVNDYKHTNHDFFSRIKLSNLYYAENDAKNISNLFKERHRAIYETYIHEPIIGKSANFENIVQRLSFICNYITKGDILLLYFSGHGLSGEKDCDDIDKQYFIPYDFNPNTKLSKSNLIDIKAIRSFLKNDEKVGQAFIFGDYCRVPSDYVDSHANILGSFFNLITKTAFGWFQRRDKKRTDKIFNDTNLEVAKYKITRIEPIEPLTKTTSLSGEIFLINATLAKGYSVESSDLKQGLFTYSLLHTIRKSKSKILTLKLLIDGTKERLKILSTQKFKQEVEIQPGIDNNFPILKSRTN